MNAVISMGGCLQYSHMVAIPHVELLFVSDFSCTWAKVETEMLDLLEKPLHVNSLRCKLCTRMVV